MNVAAERELRLADRIRSRPGPFVAGGRRHRRYLAALQRAAAADADLIRAYAALTADDIVWLEERGWQEPPHASFVRLNRLDVAAL